MHSVLLRAQLETTLGERVSSPFTDIERRVWECVSSGIPSLDAAIGGLPRGAIVEICGVPASGKTTLAWTVLAAMCRQEEVCALVDGTDAFDPESGEAAGIDMQRLLWVRCRNIDQVLRSTDLLLQGGGFGVVALDLSDLPQKALHGVPLATWFRFQRVIENTPTLLLVIGRESAAKSAAALVIRANLRQAEWKTVVGRRWPEGPDEGASSRLNALTRSSTTLSRGERARANTLSPSPSHGVLLAETQLDIEILRTRHSELRKPKVQHHVRLHSCY
jgi:recombination protein RecA